MIHFQNVSKLYPYNTVALDKINVSINRGEFVTIIGKSGAGKTTFTKLILREEKPSSGHIFFESDDISFLSHKKLTEYRRQIGFVFQDFRLLNSKTSYENIAFAMEAVGKSDEEIMTDVPHVLDLVNLENKMYQFPHEMSGGEKQRLAIARAIINQPDVIIADEPTGNLDPETTEEIVHILKKINALGTTIILVTHNPSVVRSIGGRVIEIEKGRIVKDAKI